MREWSRIFFKLNPLLPKILGTCALLCIPIVGIKIYQKTTSIPPQTSRTITKNTLSSPTHSSNTITPSSTNTPIPTKASVKVSKVYSTPTNKPTATPQATNTPTSNNNTQNNTNNSTPSSPQPTATPTSIPQPTATVTPAPPTATPTISSTPAPTNTPTPNSIAPTSSENDLMKVTAECTGGTNITVQIIDKTYVSSQPSGAWTYISTSTGNIYLAYIGPSGSNLSASIYTTAYSIRGGQSVTLMSNTTYSANFAKGDSSGNITDYISQINFTTPACY